MRGNVDEVVLLNRDTDTAGQISDITSLISQGVDAIILNPGDAEAFNSVIEEAQAQGIVVVVVDNSVTSDAAYLVSNDQAAYGELGARWLFEQLGGEGNVAYMRGIDGVGAAQTGRGPPSILAGSRRSEETRTTTSITS